MSHRYQQQIRHVIYMVAALRIHVWVAETSWTFPALPPCRNILGDFIHELFVVLIKGHRFSFKIMMDQDMDAVYPRSSNHSSVTKAQL